MLRKNQPPAEVIKALADVAVHGFHYNAFVSRGLRAALQRELAERPPQAIWDSLTAREREFLLCYPRPGVEHLARRWPRAWA